MTYGDKACSEILSSWMARLANGDSSYQNDGAGDVHFHVRDFLVDPPWFEDKGAEVSFEIEEGPERQKAVRIKPTLSPGPSPSFASLGHPGGAFRTWASVPQMPFMHRDGRRYLSVYDLLASVALKERWHFGDNDDDHAGEYPILRNYLTYTFYRLHSTSDGIAISRQDGASWATFNTGLVDELYDPIFALFRQNLYLEQPAWRFHDFCIPGKGPSGKKLTSMFDPLPDTARYFDTNFEMVLNTDREIHVDYEHVILDGIARDRFPFEFLSVNRPRDFEWEDYTAKPEMQRKNFLERLAQAVENDLRCTRTIKNQLEDAKELAEKRTRWNFKTAIPQYHPRLNVMSFLLPLALVDDEKVDIALVVTKNPSGSYQGRTVLPLHWAYQNARIVCRPDSDWLVPNRIRPAADAKEEDM